MKLLQNVEIFSYHIDNVVLFYHHLSPIYDEMAKALQEQHIPFDMKRYTQLELDMAELNKLRPAKSTANDGYTILIFDDASSLVEANTKFNQLIHTARHSRLLFILSIHGIVFTKPTARSMVS